MTSSNRNSRSVFVLPGAFDGRVETLFEKFGYQIEKDMLLADAVVFTGGTDIGTYMYKEKPLSKFLEAPDLYRDDLETRIFKMFETTKPKIGICRGAQLLNVLNGGRLWQHVSGHGRQHNAVDTKTGELFIVSSLHHQMMIPDDKGVVFCTAQESTFRENEKDGQYHGTMKTPDIEGVWYGSTKSLCWQPHPELGPEDHQKYFFDHIHEKLEI